MRRDVFPDLVGPTTKLTFPRLKGGSSSVRNVRVPPGVTAKFAESLTQVNEVWRTPIALLYSSGTGAVRISAGWNR